MAPLLVVLGITATLGLGITLARWARTLGKIATQKSSCEGCGRYGPVLEVHFHQNTGMLVARRHVEVAGALCRSCCLFHFLRMIGHNLVFGWWGTISIVVTPLFILNNVGYMLAAASLPAKAEEDVVAFLARVKSAG